MEQKYKQVMVIESPGFIARVYRPELTKEERDRRMKELHKAAAAVLLEVKRK